MNCEYNYVIRQTSRKTCAESQGLGTEQERSLDKYEPSTVQQKSWGSPDERRIPGIFLGARPASLAHKISYWCANIPTLGAPGAHRSTFRWAHAISPLTNVPYNTQKLQIGHDVCIYKVTCMHLQSYMYAFTKLQLKKLTMCVSRFIQFALGSCYAVHINALSIQWKCTSKGRTYKLN